MESGKSDPYDSSKVLGTEIRLGNPRLPLNFVIVSEIFILMPILSGFSLAQKNVLFKHIRT